MQDETSAVSGDEEDPMDTSALWLGHLANDSDVQLLERMRVGDDTAFEKLFMRHYTQVQRVLYNLVGDRQEAEDLAQETFLALYRHPPRTEPNLPLNAWLCRVALNRGYNALRSARRSQQRTERAERADVPVPSVDPSTEAVRSEERAHVRAVLATLPERQSRLLLLRHAGLSYAEIAATLELAPGSIGTLLARAERAFVTAYEQAHPTEGER